MIQILSLVLLGAILFFVFLKLAIQGPSASAPNSSAVLAVRQMVHLDGLSFAGGQRLLDAGEYQMLNATAELREVAARYRKERQGLALGWISLLLSDVHGLWRFRRFLVRSGVPATLNEEIQILSDAVQAMVFLSFLRVIIHTFGPFAFSGAARNAQGMVEKMSYTSAHVLDRLPQHGGYKIGRNWHKGLA